MQTLNTFDEPQPLSMFNQKMLVDQSIILLVAQKKGVSGVEWSGGGLGKAQKGVSMLVARRGLSRLGQEARNHTLPPLAPFHCLLSSYFTPTKNLPPHMVGNAESHPLLERGWGYNRAWEGYNEPPGLFQLQSD